MSRFCRLTNAVRSDMIVRLVCCMVVLATVVPGSMAAAEPPQRLVDFLYVEANEGSSSGGHAALRFGRQTYHFQHEQPGIIRIRRLDSAAFRHLYGRLGNRGIRASRVAVTDATYQLLQDELLERLLIQDAQLAIRDDLLRDVALFESLIRQLDRPAGQGAVPVTVAGLGYFAGGSSRADRHSGAASSAPLAAFRDRLKRLYGEEHLDRRIAETRTLLDELQLRAAVAPQISRESYPTRFLPASAPYHDAVAALAALETLLAAPPLQPGSYWVPSGNDFRLSVTETAQLVRYAEQLEQELAGLFRSPRSDWGAPFVTGMVRLVAVRESIASGRLVLANIYPDRDAEAPAWEQVRPGKEQLAALLQDRSRAFGHWRREFFAGSAMEEAGYARLERAGNLLLDLEWTMERKLPLRPVPEAAFPGRPGKLEGVALPAMGRARLARELALARSASVAYGEALQRLYAYRLVGRNCVTELFSEINRAVGRRIDQGHSSDGLLRRESERLLGGFINAAEGLNFVPIVAAHAVDSVYAVAERREYPSCRQERLAQMYRTEMPLLVFLRESNTISSTMYRPGRDDSCFLFFTDDMALLRPFFGSFNLLAGLGDSLLGTVLLPVAGPDRLISGARGVFFSLPELFFVNIRKGSLEDPPTACRADMELPAPSF